MHRRVPASRIRHTNVISDAGLGYLCPPFWLQQRSARETGSSTLPPDRVKRRRYFLRNARRRERALIGSAILRGRDGWPSTGISRRDITVTEETREAIVESFDEYWGPIEAGTGQLPQAYLALPERDRRAVRDEVRARLSTFESAGRYRMSAAMIIGAGCA
jgi:hypothetical protein